ncbi:hypothetical protein GUJ93_ZPchr0002g24077 [Zizania palustris]|uniref:Uncharacterized protein n=1 Tax=Zizania palustris TaxID=103762 RepID=A0A8J5S354_ZIZPA|nr:hypothetical protein GUJ93_ZPchr0002g24077 [Zizania palustris]
MRPRQKNYLTKMPCPTVLGKLAVHRFRGRSASSPPPRRFGLYHQFTTIPLLFGRQQKGKRLLVSYIVGGIVPVSVRAASEAQAPRSAPPAADSCLALIGPG